MKGKLIKCNAVIILLIIGYAQAGWNVGWNTVDYPGAEDTRVLGINGGTIVGCYNLGSHGFLYDGINWTTIDKPGATKMWIHGIEGDNLVGWFNDVSGTHGFVYDGTNWTTIAPPGSTYTKVLGIDGSNLVGWFNDVSGTHGFVYDGTNWTTLDMPGVDSTLIYGIDGDNLVGSYIDLSINQERHGLYYDGSNWTALDDEGIWPIPAQPHSTEIMDIDGSTLVGFCQTYYSQPQHVPYGFTYDGTWAAFDEPESFTRVYGIDGSIFVGSYGVAADTSGFVYVVPEPGTFLLLGFGVATLRKKIK